MNVPFVVVSLRSRREAVHRFDLPDLARVILKMEGVHGEPAAAVQLAEAAVGRCSVESLVALDLRDGHEELLTALVERGRQLGQTPRVYVFHVAGVRRP